MRIDHCACATTEEGGGGNGKPGSLKPTGAAVFLVANVKIKDGIKFTTRNLFEERD